MNTIDTSVATHSVSKTSSFILHPSSFKMRVGFWRALVELAVLTLVLSLVSYMLANMPAWAIFLFTLVSLSLYVYAAWRLEAGHGPWWRRGGRVLLWLLLLSLSTGGLGWAMFTYAPPSGSYLGMRYEDLTLPLFQYLLNSITITAGLLLPSRVLIALWAAGQTRMRSWLTASYMLIGVITAMLLPVAMAFFIAVNSLFAVPPVTNPASIAAPTAGLLAPLLEQQQSPAALEATLNGLFTGTTRLPVTKDDGIDDNGIEPLFAGVRRLILLQPDGSVLASAGESALPAGAPLPAAQASQLALLLGQAQGGACVHGRPTDGPLADVSVCGVRASGGALLGTLVVESKLDSTMQFGAGFARIVRLTLSSVNLVIVLMIFSVFFILLLALGVGYMLARRLTNRVERLATATGDVAAGNLDRRVEVDSHDELGRLGHDFNSMAVRLAEREQALKLEKERAERLLHANRQLVANVSHELRTPLATLRGYLEALDHDHGDKLPAHDMAVIRGEVGRLTTLIDDLFTVARAEAQQLPLSMQSVDVRELATTLAETLAPLARRERQIEVIAALPDQLPPVQADRARLEQVLLNLAQNALRHTPPGGIVAFEGSANDDHVLLSVADTGIGIPPDELELVFERFYRGDSSRARETGGAGLGLALVKELTEAMGGHVAVESSPGKGTRFTLHLRRVVGEE